MQSYTWFYSLPNSLTESQEQALKVDFETFLHQWKSHGTPVEGMIQLKHRQFVIIQSNPADSRPSGCSIDSLKRAIEQILSRHGLQWVDASNVFYIDKTGEIQRVNFRELPQLIEAKTIGPDTIVLDHTLSQSDDLSLWERPLSQTWMKRYLPTKPVGNKQ